MTGDNSGAMIFAPVVAEYRIELIPFACHSLMLSYRGRCLSRRSGKTEESEAIRVARLAKGRRAST